MEYLIGFLNYAISEEEPSKKEYLTTDNIGSKPGDLVALDENGKIPEEFYDSAEMSWIVY